MRQTETEGRPGAPAAYPDGACDDLASLAAMVTAAHLRGTPTPAGEIPDLIARIGRALASLKQDGPIGEPAPALADVSGAPADSRDGAGEGEVEDAPVTAPPAPDADGRPEWMPAGTYGPQRPPSAPAVPIDQTHGYDYVICLEDGRRMKMLKRHLKRTYNMSAEQYIRKWGLPEDYPLSCRAFREQRRAIATDLGFQTKARQPSASTPEPQPQPKPKQTPKRKPRQRAAHASS